VSGLQGLIIMVIIKPTSFGEIHFSNPVGLELWGWDYVPKPNRDLTPTEMQEVQEIFTSLKEGGYFFPNDED
jgi:hypothetical protein